MNSEKEKGKVKSEKVRKSKLYHSSPCPVPLYLVWLEWPEKCFRMDAETLRCLELSVRGKGRVVRVRSEEAFLRALPQATHALVWNFRSEWFALAPRLRLVATPAAGRELVPETGPRGVKVHFGAFHGEIMAESVAAFMLAWSRGFFRLRAKEISNDPWPRAWLSDKCSTVRTTNAVVFGFGNVGRAIGDLLNRLCVGVTGVTRHGVYQTLPGRRRPQQVDERVLDEALGSADWVILALPSTTGTDNFFDEKLIRKLPRKCVVINVGRGNVVDEKALYRALRTKRLAGAYLDVRKHEPSATVLESPGYVPELASLPNCVITPHSAAFDGNYLRMFIGELVHDRCL